jgi:DNA polymerase-3 subunit delta'
VGRARRLSRDADARERRRAVLALPASLRSLADTLAAADGLVGAAEREAAGIATELDGPEMEALRLALGAGGTGKGTAGTTRGTIGITKDLERRQKARATRAQRDALDRALVDLAGFYRDVLVLQFGAGVPLAHPDVTEQAAAVAATLTPAGTLARLEAILACRTELEQNVKPRFAVGALALALRGQ